MSQASLWFGYLNIGDKSSPVAKNQKLCTGKPDTVYIFNLKRNEIIEYKCDIVEPKLRELTKDEADIKKELKKAFTKAAKTFTPRIKAQTVSESVPVKAKPEKKEKVMVKELAAIEMADEDDIFDDNEDED